jgi:hypothetical protein
MSKNDDSDPIRSVRLSQTIVPFGVGAIYDYLGESLVCCDTTMWKLERTRVLEARRLALSLQIDELRSPKTNVVDSGNIYKALKYGLPFCRFPKWLFCQLCRRLARVSFEDLKRRPRCSYCPSEPQLVPMRFIMVCKAGHMDDFPWDYFVHRGGSGYANHTLYFESDDKAGFGLESLSVRCADDGSKANLRGITSEELAKAMGLKCSGRQPWQPPHLRTSCTEQVVVVQRGASNVYFADVKSALEIPEDARFAPYSELDLRVREHPMFQVLLTRNDDFVKPMFGIVASECGSTELEVQIVVQKAKDDLSGVAVPSTGFATIADAEWLAFTGLDEQGERLKNFVARRVPPLSKPPVDDVQRRLVEILDRVVTVDRLREVRALNGFSRYSPDAPLNRPSLTHKPKWLPAVEAFGEGVFVALSEPILAAWELNGYAVRRAKELQARKSVSLFGNRILPEEVTPRFVLLHTFAHILVRQLAFDSGYPASSLRERVYARPPNLGAGQAGVLIYTSAGDAEGTMGGLARLASSSRLLEAILSALETAYWCSSDPLCKESRGQGFNALNFAACHACCLLAETSCVYGNTLLDRNFLFSEQQDGFFDGVITEALALSASDL